MSQRPKVVAGSLPTLAKCPPGIRGLDDVTNNSFPRGRSTLIHGSSDSATTLMGMHFLVRGIEGCGEPGVFQQAQSHVAGSCLNRLRDRHD